jgi:hemoglobin/transferrin/lactoferrin receptor protein
MRTAFHLSSGFRTPNIDDAARIFESSTSQRRLILPNPNIRPERTYNADLNWILRIDNKIRFEGALFYTLYRDAITLAPFQLNGSDSVDYNGSRAAVFANQNARKGYLFGIQARMFIQVNKQWSIDNTITQNEGEYQTAGGKIPLDHIPPVFGRSGLQYQHKRVQAEAFLLFNGWKRLQDYNLDGEDNLQYATPDGMPSWMTVNLRFQVEVSKQIQIQGSLENLTDRNYRVFASGLSAPGRSWMITVRSSF